MSYRSHARPIPSTPWWARWACRLGLHWNVIKLRWTNELRCTVMVHAKCRWCGRHEAEEMRPDPPMHHEVNNVRCN